MTENTICPICGGYIGSVIVRKLPAYAPDGTSYPEGNVPPINVCPGHKTTDADLAGHSPNHIMCTGVGPELYTLPAGSSIYPNNHLQQQEALWEIAQEVAETDSTCDGEEDIYGVPVNHFCPFCGNEQIHVDRKDGKEFPHRDNCIVTKARALMEWRKAQPRMELTFTQASDGTSMANALIRWQKIIDQQKGGEE